jgi:O-antigen ligase
MGNTIQRTAGRANYLLLPLLAFSLTVSTSALSVLAILVFLCWVIEGGYREKATEIFRSEVAVAVLIYLGLHVVGLLWTADMDSGLDMLGKQWKLALMPVFLTTVQPARRRRCIFFFLAGLVAVMVTTYLAWFDIFHYGGVTPDHPTRRVFHVVYNPLLALGFYFVMHEVLWGRITRGLRAGLVVVALAMALNMFITEGRAGQVAFFVMLALLMLQYYRKNIWKGLIIAGVVLPVIFLAGYTLSPTFQKRVNMVREEVSSFTENPNTSIGLRLQFWKNSWEIIKNNPLVGVGTGDFKMEYARVNWALSPAMVATDNPHNQYVLVLSQFGLMGLAALLAVFWVQIRQAMAVEDEFQRVRFAFPLFFLVIMLSESYLIVYETGFAFSFFSAVLYTLEAGPAKIREY